MVAQVTVAVCGNNSSSNRFFSEWYCQRQSMGRSIITSILPTVLLMLWQNLFMPNALYRCAPSCRCLCTSIDLPLNPALGRELAGCSRVLLPPVHPSSCGRAMRPDGFLMTELLTWRCVTYQLSHMQADFPPNLKGGLG